MSQKLKNIFLTGGATAILALAIPASVLAVGVTASNDITVPLTVASVTRNFTIVSGSTWTTLTVNASSIAVTVDGADIFKIRSSDKLKLDGVSYNCLSSFSEANLTGGTYTITPTGTVCSSGGTGTSTVGSGGGGGGGGVSPTTSTVTVQNTAAATVDSPIIASDGIAKATVTVVVKNTAGTKMAGVPVAISTSRGPEIDKVQLVSSSSNTDLNGEVKFSVSSTIVGKTKISVRVDLANTLLLAQPEITFAKPTAEAPVVTKVETTKTGITTTLSDGAMIERATNGTVTITVGTKKTTVADSDNVRSSKSTAGVLGLPSATIFRVRGQTIDLYADETIFWSYYPTCGKTWSATCLGLSSKLLPAHIGAAWPTQGAFFGYKAGTIISVKLGATTKYYAIADKVYQLTAATAAEKSAAIAVRPIMTSVAFSYNNGDGGKVANTSAISTWSQ